jgi:hypothetical protein
LLIAQQVLNNDAVIKMVKAGFSDDMIVATVNGVAGSYDTSADGLIALKSAGVSEKVVAAIVAKATAPAPVLAAPAPAAATSAFPAGIDDIGVYYKDQTGAWTPLMPEMVNFKSGGVMKSFATNGLVKGDINGRIAGAHAKTSLTFPAVFAIYVPEGTDITEYQLLRLHVNSSSREFRSITGGIVHASGGATRDVVDFKPVKIAHRVFQITIDNSNKQGEFGILPPGAVGTANLGSGGKIYSFGIQ